MKKKSYEGELENANDENKQTLSYCDTSRQ